MKLKDGFKVEQQGMGFYIVRAVGERKKEYPQAFQMGLSGAYLWDLLSSGDRERSELIFMLEGLFDDETDTNQVAADVDIFLNFLREQNLLENG